MARQSRSRKSIEPSESKRQRSPRKAAKTLSASTKKSRSAKPKSRTAKPKAAASSEPKHSRISRAVDRISSTVRRTLRKEKNEVPAVEQAKPKRPKTDVAVHADTAVRPRKIVKSDRLDDVAETIPSQQNFRDSFDERHSRGKDENTLAGADLVASRFSDEDRYTNRSKDPRIGTRGRRYHP